MLEIFAGIIPLVLVCYRIVLPIMSLRFSSVNYTQLMIDFSLSSICFPLFLTTLYYRYYLNNPSKERDDLCVQLYYYTHMWAVVISANKSEGGFLVPLVASGYCMLSIGGSGIVAEFIAPVLAITGVMRSAGRLFTSVSAFWKYFNVLFYLLEMMAFLYMYYDYFYNLEKDNRYFQWDRIVALYTVVFLYSGRLSGNESIHSIDRSMPFHNYAKPIVYLSVSDAVCRHANMIDYLDGIELLEYSREENSNESMVMQLPPPLESPPPSPVVTRPPPPVVVIPLPPPPPSVKFMKQNPNYKGNKEGGTPMKQTRRRKGTTAAPPIETSKV